jgi:diphthine synthase
LLYLVGVGIGGISSLSIGSIEILNRCDIIYIDSFTGLLSNDFVKEIRMLEKTTNNHYIKNDDKIRPAKRWFVEDGREILKNSVEKMVCILIYGDPLIATTYAELLVRAKKQSIPYKIIHASSGISSLIGESGLHYYKFGKMVTMMSDSMSSITVYNTLYNNICLGLHTLILTEYNNDKMNFDFNFNNDPFFLSPKKVFELLLDRENELKLLNLTKDSFAIVASQIGTDNSKIICGKIKSLLNYQFDYGFSSIIIPGRLHFTEIDCLENLTIILDSPIDNSLTVDTLSKRMLKKYIPNAKKAIVNLLTLIKNKENVIEKEYSIIFENAENYIIDAENFYRQGQHELAILSIGYAEGLLDSIRYQKGMNPW